MRLTPRARTKLKRPLGTLKPAIDIQQLRHARSSGHPIIAVGDTTARNLRVAGIPADLEIVDGREQRHPTELQTTHSHQLHAANPPGQITSEAEKAVITALISLPSSLIIEGEEDLLTLTAILRAPEEAIILYGQPGKGVVVISVGPRVRQRAKAIIAEMAPPSSEG